MRAQCKHPAGSEQRERLMSTSREAPLGQGLSALVMRIRVSFRGLALESGIYLLRQPAAVMQIPA